MNLDPYIHPNDVLLIAFCVVLLIVSTIALVSIGKERHREQASQSAEVDHPLTQPAQEARASAAPTLRELRAASAARAEMARRAQAGSLARRAAHAAERGSSARIVQPQRRRSTWSSEHELEAPQAATLLGDAVVTRTTSPLFLGFGVRNG